MRIDGAISIKGWLFCIARHRDHSFFLGKTHNATENLITDTFKPGEQKLPDVKVFADHIGLGIDKIPMAWPAILCCGTK